MVLWIVLRHNSATATQGHKERAAIFRDCTASDTAEAAAWPPGTSAMARRVREHDWAATPLGSVDTWSERVKAVVEMTRLVEVQRAYQNMSALLAKTDELRAKAISRLADQQA